MSSLTELSGVGNSLAKKLVEVIGSEEEVQRVLQEFDVTTLSGIDGISTQRAIKLINTANGNLDEITVTEEGCKIHKDIMNKISSHVKTNAGKDRLSILVPLSRKRISEIKKRRQWSEDATRFIIDSPLSFSSWCNAIDGLDRTKKSINRIDRVVVVPDTQTLDFMSHLSHRCRILVRSADETWNDYVGLSRVTWIGKDPPNQIPAGWVIGKMEDPINLLIPEIPLYWLNSNFLNLSILVNLMSIEWPINKLGEKIRESFDALKNLPLLLRSLENTSSKLDILEQIRDGLWAEIKSVEGAINDAIISGTSDASISFDGDEVLSFYSDIGGLEKRLKGVVEDSIEQALEAGRERLAQYLDSTGVRLPVEIYSSDYPCAINREILERIENKIDTAIEFERSSGEMIKADATIKIMQPARDAIASCIEIDMWLGIAHWAVTNKCIIPDIYDHNPGIWIREGRHLLLDCDPEPVTYGLGDVSPINDRDRIALLSGANSGGKTTLLELLGSIVILAHTGLPVPASEARIGLLDEIHMLAKVSGTQSAGALERTLKRLAEVLVSPKRKLVLADELEAITEPGSAALILGGLLSVASNNENTNVLLVTHIAPSIRDVMSNHVRIDGIEAQGLDENMDLIVDRTPRRNHIARSTPELIVRRLAARSSGPTEKIFTNLLKSF